MSYLDDPRVLFAAERTLLAWQRTVLALMGSGFVDERLGLLLRMVGNQPLSPSQRGFSLWLGVALLVIGAGVAVVSAVQFRTVLRGLGEHRGSCSAGSDTALVPAEGMARDVVVACEGAERLVRRRAEGSRTMLFAEVSHHGRLVSFHGTSGR